MAQDDIQGQVVDAQGNPVEGAIVEVTPARRDDSELEENVVRVSTNSNGEYRVWYHPQGDGTTQEWHVSAYNHNGSAYVNSFNNPGVTADLPSNAIPDAEDLHARYDARELSASDGDPISTWPDETGNGQDLTAGTAPSYNASGINSNPCVRFDRSNSEYLSVDWTDVSQPLSVFLVFQQVTTDSFDYLFDGYSADNVALENNGSGNYRVFAGNTVDQGSIDTNSHIGSIIYDGTSSDFRIDGSDIFTGSDLGSNAMDGLTIGMAGNGDKQPADVNVMIMLVYQNDKTGKVSEIESYLSNQSGIAV